MKIKSDSRPVPAPTTTEPTEGSSRLKKSNVPTIRPAATRKCVGACTTLRTILARFSHQATMMIATMVTATTTASAIGAETGATAVMATAEETKARKRSWPR